MGGKATYTGPPTAVVGCWYFGVKMGAHNIVRVLCFLQLGANYSDFMIYMYTCTHAHMHTCTHTHVLSLCVIVVLSVRPPSQTTQTMGKVQHVHTPPLRNMSNWLVHVYMYQPTGNEDMGCSS